VVKAAGFSPTPVTRCLVVRGAARALDSVPSRTIAGVAYDDVLAERVRDRVAGVAGVREKRMFGGLAFLTDGNMTVGVHGDDLIVRIALADTDAALTQPGARPFDITGRPMRGWLLVAGEVLDDPVLDGWIDQARAFVATLPPK
jgi:TfoX/Sxy family transcriptional regulator of competence genes